jgi:hypothetical protein
MIWAIVIPIFLIAVVMGLGIGYDVGMKDRQCKTNEQLRAEAVNQEIDYLYEQAWREIKGQ